MLFRISDRCFQLPLEVIVFLWGKKIGHGEWRWRRLGTRLPDSVQFSKQPHSELEDPKHENVR